MSSPIYCFRASCELSTHFDKQTIPEWLCLSVNWQGYRISTVPWIADVAQVLGILHFENTPEAWISYLESLGLRDITQISCEDYFEDTLYT